MIGDVSEAGGGSLGFLILLMVWWIKHVLDLASICFKTFIFTVILNTEVNIKL